MIAEPLMEPVMPQVDPIDLLIAFEEAASPMPIRAEYIEGTGIVPPQPEHRHNAGAIKLIVQLHMAGMDLAGAGDGFRVAHTDGRTMALVVPDL